MVKLIERTYSVPQGKLLCNFIIDSDSDVESLPACETGSTAIVASGGEYIVNASGEWVKRY